MVDIILFLGKWYWIFGLLGCLIVMVGILPTAIVYRGVKGQRYNLLNHYISELGELGVSRLAKWFNGSMIVTGAFFLPFTTGLGLALGNVWAYLGIATGLWAGISCLLVGVFPMNNLTPHSRVATAYFRGGLATVLLFTVAIFFQAVDGQGISRWANLAGLAAIASYASFIVLSGRKKPDDNEDQQEGQRNNDELSTRERPGFWLMPALEWLVFITTILWFLVITLCA